MKSFKKYLAPEKKQLKTEERLTLTDAKVLSGLKDKNVLAFSDYHDIHIEEVVRSKSNDRKIIPVVDLISENPQEFLEPKVIAGLNGAPGFNGLPGAPGKDGRGINKTFIIDNNLLIKYDDGEQKLIGEVVGPQGLQGDVGLTGEKGDKGDTGEKGDIGPQGMTLGIRGDTGEKGDKGDTGDTGPQGLSITGEKGDKGDTGEKGDIGAIGETGPQGIQGVKGLQGIQGFKGDKGDIGETGPQGLIGLQGIQGYTGDKGDKGDIGPKGLTGKKGDTGDIPNLLPFEEKFQKLSVDITKRVDRAVFSLSSSGLNGGGGSGSYSLNDLSDTDHSSIINATNAQVLTYSTSNNKWFAADASAGGGADSYARTTANAAFDAANSATVLAQAGYNTANSANVLAQDAYNTANSATVLAQAAYDDLLTLSFCI